MSMVKIESVRVALFVRMCFVEPLFDLLSKLLSITGAHKPLPLRGLAYIPTFLGIGILLLQLSMLMNVRCGLPT